MINDSAAPCQRSWLAIWFTHMKTTVDISDTLFESTRRLAVQRGTTMRALIALTLLFLSIAAPACAGNLLDLAVVDRDTGATLRTYAQDGKLYVAGTPGHRYAVRLRNRSGARVLAVVSVDGAEVSRLGAGDHFGAIALIADRVRTATVTAETDLHCYVMTLWDFRSFVQGDAEIAWKLLEQLAQMVQKTSGHQH